MPDRTVPLRSATGLSRTPWTPQPGQPWSSLSRQTGLRARAPGAGTVTELRPKPVAASTIPPDVLALVDLRDEHYCVLCGRYQEAIEHHHRRIKGSGGDTRPHAECACNILSLCPWWTDSRCHPRAHLERRRVGEPEGLVIPRSASSPWLYSVAVHGREDAGGVRAWPTCTGAWSTDEPEGWVA